MNSWLQKLAAGRSVFVSSSRHETWGLAAAEALSFGIPVVLADNSGHSEVVKGSSSLLYALGNVQDGAGKVASCLLNPLQIKPIVEKLRDFHVSGDDTIQGLRSFSNSCDWLIHIAPAWRMKEHAPVETSYIFSRIGPQPEPTTIVPDALPLFNASWYVQCNPDVVSAGLDRGSIILAQDGRRAAGRTPCSIDTLPRPEPPMSRQQGMNRLPTMWSLDGRRGGVRIPCSTPNGISIRIPTLKPPGSSRLHTT